MTKAQAVWFSAPNNVELREEELNDPGPGEVLIEAELSAISAGSEMLVYRGLAPPGLAPDLPTVAGSFSFPIKFGYASVGRVVERGRGTRHLRSGQRVFAFHPHQTHYLAPASLVVALPRGMPPEVGIFFPNLETAFNVLLDAHPRLGETVSVFGQGIVGLLITALARMAGVGRLIAVDPFEKRRWAARRMGADLTLDPSEALPTLLHSLSDGRGLDLAIEASGSNAALQPLLDSLAFQGTAVLAAWYGSQVAQLKLGDRFHRQRLRVISSQVSNLDPSLSPRWDRERRTEVVLNLLSRLDLSGLISHRIPLSDAARAYRLLQEHPEETLQVVFSY